MRRHGATLPSVILVILLLISAAQSNNASHHAQVKNVTQADNATQLAASENATQFVPEEYMNETCSLNQTLYTCSAQHRCCQSQSDVLIEQLNQIKVRFRGVDTIIRKDYDNIKGLTLEATNSARSTLSDQLLSKYRLLFQAFNRTIGQLYSVFLGHGKSDDLRKIARELPQQILLQTFTRPDSNVAAQEFPRNIKGINIFWEMNGAQRDCVVDYMMDSTEMGRIVTDISSNMSNSTQSLHEYMSLLGTMVKIIKNMVDAPETNNCIQEIVKMQQCSLCTEKPVCLPFYEQLLSQCIPQLKDLYARWDTLMSAMAELTLRLCEHSLDKLYTNIFVVSEYIERGNLEAVIYQHGVLAYMKCVQPDSHKRSILDSSYGRSQESMLPEQLETVQHELLGDQYVYQDGGSLMDDIKLHRRDVSQGQTAETHPPTEAPTGTTTTAGALPGCREKLGLSFPPLDLGTNSTLLNIARTPINQDCWNGSSVGSYYVDTVSSHTVVKPETQQMDIRELDDKLCRYARECVPPEEPAILNNSHHGPALLQVLASLAASLYYCCC